MCIVCQTAPLLAAGGGGAGMIWRSTRVALGRCGPYEDHAAWAAWAAGRPPSDDEMSPRAPGRELTARSFALMALRSSLRSS